MYSEVAIFLSVFLQMNSDAEDDAAAADVKGQMFISKVSIEALLRVP